MDIILVRDEQLHDMDGIKPLIQTSFLFQDCDMLYDGYHYGMIHLCK